MVFGLTHCSLEGGDSGSLDVTVTGAVANTHEESIMYKVGPQRQNSLRDWSHAFTASTSLLHQRLGGNIFIYFLKIA